MLLDFGAARQALGEQTRALTGMVTPGYAPFEQYNSRSKQGPWTDLYSIGATMYHCLAGKPPAESPDRIAALQEQEADPMPPAVVAGQGRYRPEFLAVVHAMLAPLPKDRPQHIEQVLERLRAHIHAVVGRYRGRVFAWDVVNEVVDPAAPGCLRNDRWLQAVGPRYVEAAFRYAHEADPGARLFVNDFETTQPPKRDCLLGLVRDLP